MHRVAGIVQNALFSAGLTSKLCAVDEAEQPGTRSEARQN